MACANSATATARCWRWTKSSAAWAAPQALRDGLESLNAEFSLFSEVRGRGLMLGAVLKPEYAGRAGEILDHAAAHGLLLLQAGPDVLRFVPALNITDAEVADGLVRLRSALSDFAKKTPAA